MSLDLETLRQTALEAVQRVSPEAWTHRRVDTGGYNPETGAVGSPVTTETPVWGYCSKLHAGIAFAGGSLVQIGDQKANIPAGQGIEPTAGDQLDIAGASWVVVAVNASPGIDMPVMWEAQVRR